jgi:hypothetical protein
VFLRTRQREGTNEVVGEFQTWSVCGRVLEVDDDELFVLVCGVEEWRFA